MTDEEKHYLKKFDEYLTDWWKGNLKDLEQDPLYKNYTEKIKAKDPETLFACKMGGAIAVKFLQNEYQKQLYNKYVKN